MTFKSALFAARHHLVFMLGLAASSGLILALDSIDSRGQPGTGAGTAPALPRIEVSDRQLPGPEPLTDARREQARIAWRYFVNNTAASGLVNSVDHYPAATVWDSASSLLAMISAERLGIIDRPEFDRRVGALLAAFAKMPLYDGKLPNKSYNTQTLAMVDYTNQPAPNGIGWSAIDLGRVLVPFNLLVWHYPQHTAAARAVLARWQFAAIARDGVMQGAARDPKAGTVLLQEGRLGYEQYAAKSLLLMGLDVHAAAQWQPFLRFERIEGIEVPVDVREPETHDAHNYTLSEPFVLDGLEFGWDRISGEFAHRVYTAQEARYRRTGVLTAVSEDNLDEAPYFAYNTVYTSGKAWNTITDTGADASAHRALSTKAAFGWDALLRTDYTAKLMDKVQPLHDPERGWYAGWYDAKNRPNRALTANTNAVVLESIAYRTHGPLLGLSAATATGDAP